MQLSGVELRNFRSIGPEPVILSPLRKCNIIVGKNNVGKSNVLAAVKKLSDRYQPDPKAAKLEDLDFHRRSGSNPFIAKLWFEIDHAEKADVELEQVMGTSAFWFEVKWEVGRSPTVTDHTFAQISDWRQANQALDRLVGRTWAGPVSAQQMRKEFIERAGEIFARFSPHIPPVHIIPEFRQITVGDPYRLDGTNLIGLLGRYQIPEIGRDEDQEKFGKIQEFVRQLLHLPRAVLEVISSNPTIIISNDGLRLPLASYGTGVHELLILVTAVLFVNDAICCIEEPEIHLHPRMQRAFVQFLMEHTSNTYLISTHSPTLINLVDENAQVFHLVSDGGATVGAPILESVSSLRAIRDLGLKASDLLQSDCVIWVEGPSDRIYLRRWLELLAPDLAEGRDYVFMPFKGLPNLRIEDGIYADAVNVLQLNRNAIILIDSDLSEEGGRIAVEKKDAKERCEKSGGFCWITDGREIENYVPRRVIAAACRDIRGMDIELDIGPYERFDVALDQALRGAGVRPAEYANNKLSLSRKFAEHFTEGDITGELKDRLEELVSRIRGWST